MKNRIIHLILIAALLSLTLTACKLPASKAPAIVTQVAATALPTATPPKTISDIISGTATAAKALTPTPIVIQPTKLEATKPEATKADSPKPAQPTATPKVEPTAIPTATRPTVVVFTTPERPATYSLQKGEFPICIARRYNLEVGNFLAINGMNMQSKPDTGTLLRIPQSGTWDSGTRALKSHPDKYQVEGGDTVNSIACKYGDVFPEAIMADNGLSGGFTLNVGQTLSIP